MINRAAVLLAGYINQSTPRAGYYFSFTFTVIGASLLFLSKMYRRSSPPQLFLGRGRASPPSFHRSSQDGAVKEPSRVQRSQEPLLYRAEGLCNGAATIRTVHQDVCTCPHPQVPPPPPPPPSVDDPLRLPKQIGRRIVRKLRLNSIPWKHNRFTEFFALHAGQQTAMANGGSTHQMPAKQSTSAPPAGYAYDVDWEPDYWDNMGSCAELDAECELCQTCADCGLPLDDEDEDECSADDCHIHSAVLPDAIDIPELPPEVQNNYSSLYLINSGAGAIVSVSVDELTPLGSPALTSIDS